MSAFLVDPEHINVLVYAAARSTGHDGPLRWSVPDDSKQYGYAVRVAHCEHVDRIGQMLLDQNTRSVNDRYSEDNAYVYSYRRPKFTEWLPVDVLKALSCYEYQSCETSDWEQTEVYRFCQALRLQLIRLLTGYDSAPWEITASTVPAHVAAALESRAERQAVLQGEQQQRVAEADAALAAGSTVLPGERRVLTSAEYAAVSRAAVADAAADAKRGPGTVIPFPTVAAVVASNPPSAPNLVEPSDDRDRTIKAIRTALRKRSGKSWSVRGGRGTAWGWITITAPPARTDRYGRMSDEDRAELSQLLGKDVHHQGESVPSSIEYRREYVARAEGRAPEVTGEPYWD